MKIDGLSICGLSLTDVLSKPTLPSGYGQIYFQGGVLYYEDPDAVLFTIDINEHMSDRGCFFGGYNPLQTPAYKNGIEYITISVLGVSGTFGDMSVVRHNVLNSGIASLTRGIMAGGKTSSTTYTDSIDYITIATIGNATDYFGDLTATRSYLCSVCNKITGIFISGLSDKGIDYITIATAGNATDGGTYEPNNASVYNGETFSTPSYGLYFSGYQNVNWSCVFPFYAPGAYSLWGELTDNVYGYGSVSNGVIGVAVGKNMKYWNLIAFSQQSDFGTLPTNAMRTALCSLTRFVTNYSADVDSPVGTNLYCHFATKGQCNDFGATGLIMDAGAFSGAHGGLI